MPGIAGLSKAAEIAAGKIEHEMSYLNDLKDRLIDGILKNVANSQLNGHPEKRLPGNINISFSGIKSEILLLSLDMKGVFCSAGSACNSKTIEPSHVLRAIGLQPEIAASALRFSLGRYTTEDDIAHALEIIITAAGKLRKD